MNDESYYFTMDTPLDRIIDFGRNVTYLFCGKYGTRRYYHLRFVLDGIRSLFRLVALKCFFLFKSNSLCKSEKLAAFLW